MNFKTANILIFSIILFFISIGAIEAATRPLISIYNYDVLGGPLNVDDNHFTLELELINSGDLCAKAVTVTVQANSPFMTDETPTSDPVDICDHEYVYLPLKLEPNAVGGSYPLNLVFSYSDNGTNNIYSFANTITLFIKGASDINAHVVNSNPVNVYPGNSATISVLIENDGTYPVQSVNGVLSAKQPLEVKFSNSFFSVGLLQPKQSYIADFSVELPKDAQAQIYPMTLSLQYLENKEIKTKNIQLYFDVKKRASFEITDVGSELLYPNDFGKIIKLRVMNSGTNLAKEIKIQIQPQYPFTTDGSIRYITNLEPGESSVVQFAIDVDKSATIGDYGVELILDYKDEEDNILQDSATASLTIQKKGFFRSVFIDYWYLWLILVIIVIIILARLSRRRKRKVENK